MRLTPAPAFRAPKVSLPQPHFPTPKAPKITSVNIRPLNGGGFHVTHNFTAPKQPKQFAFDAPAKVTQHLRRIENTAWLHPAAKPANRTVEVLNEGEVP